MLPLESRYRQPEYQNSIQPSELYATRDLIRQITLTEASVSDEELEKLLKYREIFSQNSQEYRDALEGNITIGLIKPHTEAGINEEIRTRYGLPKKDDSIVRHLIANEVVQNAEVVGLQLDLGLAVQLSRKQAEEFYALNKEQFVKFGFWDDVMNFTSSGPLTVLLLRDAKGEGQAVQKWRTAIGTTKVIPGENSLRGRYAKPNNLPNNMFHGSGNPEEAARELVIVGDVLQELYDQLEQRHDPDLLKAAQRSIPSHEHVLYVRTLTEERKNKDLPPRVRGRTAVSVNGDSYVHERRISTKRR